MVKISYYNRGRRCQSPVVVSMLEDTLRILCLDSKTSSTAKSVFQVRDVLTKMISATELRCLACN